MVLHLSYKINCKDKALHELTAGGSLWENWSRKHHPHPHPIKGPRR